MMKRPSVARAFFLRDLHAVMKRIVILMLSVALLIIMSDSYAAVQINSTRLVYPANEREITVQLTNVGKEPVLMQAWVDTGNPDATAQEADAPFLITPPIFRLDGKKGQTIRIMYAGKGLPTDRESVYWFNALEVPTLPTSSDVNYLQIALRSRLKLFYRPLNLEGSPAEAVKKNHWSLERVDGRKTLSVKNDSPFYISYTHLEIQGAKGAVDLGGMMVEPFASKQIKVNEEFTKPLSIKYQWMNDYGPGPSAKVTVE